ncbi:MULTISPECIES: sce7726 family protein [unclassified Curtobacterium]|uniref:sce7726 family protein n=1 Tax=unclassified Curtobacterium TaxID=257496 RepID=UPI0008DC5BC5|nr:MULTISPECIES: sce7726 family protein [unclassified Curtobacterium]OIH99749.1 hypothetical protein BIU92_02430 [Curtobacterium sp. MCBA15_003]OII30414.1 hypothetical protein BIU94_06460 [Curtobacterium sp. MMLR14_006]
MRTELIPEPSVADAAALLSSATYRNLSTTHPLDALSRIARVAPLAASQGAQTIGDVLDIAYAALVSDYRNEYVFKNTVVSRIVFGKHKPTTASAILELPLGTSFADVAIFNGTSTVYEIKTDLDSFSRLESQLRDYCSRAEFVNVVVSDRRAATVQRHLPESIGIMALRRNGAIQTVRAAESNLGQLRSDHLFDSLRRAEAEAILRASGHTIVAADPLERWNELREAFAALDPHFVHSRAVVALRERGMKAASVAADPSLPLSARALAYSAPLSNASGRRLLDRLRQPIPPVWGC